ncbi:uncharacterized protein [Saccopteryx bilineata]|uniref:uncharacterized protein n=1 Tax=Saccopteryx bilineata TaxID=59482 RepID=UPI00338F7B88
MWTLSSTREMPSTDARPGPSHWRSAHFILLCKAPTHVTEEAVSILPAIPVSMVDAPLASVRSFLPFHSDLIDFSLSGSPPLPRGWKDGGRFSPAFLLYRARLEGRISHPQMGAQQLEPQPPQLEQEQAGTQQHTGLQQGTQLHTGTQQLEPQPPQLEPQPPQLQQEQVTSGGRHHPGALTFAVLTSPRQSPSDTCGVRSPAWSLLQTVNHLQGTECPPSSDHVRCAPQPFPISHRAVQTPSTTDLHHPQWTPVPSRATSTSHCPAPA